MSSPLVNPNFPPELQPGVVIEFSDATELRPFEDVIAPYVDPSYNPSLWKSRTNLKDELRPPKFNGRIADITMTVMVDPYERLQDFRERGWTFSQRGGKFERNSELGIRQRDHYIGFVVSAAAQSSGRGKIGILAWRFGMHRAV